MKKMLITVFITMLLMFTSACSKQEMTSEKVKVSTPSKEDLMLKQLEGDDLLAVMESSMQIPAEQQKPNKLAIKNAYDRPQSFRVEICEHCSFAETQVEIGPGEIKVLDFDVRGVPGEKTVVIRDDLNNFYAKESFTVTN